MVKTSGAGTAVAYRVLVSAEYEKVLYDVVLVAEQVARLSVLAMPEYVVEQLALPWCDLLSCHAGLAIAEQAKETNAKKKIVIALLRLR